MPLSCSPSCRNSCRLESSFKVMPASPFFFFRKNDYQWALGATFKNSWPQNASAILSEKPVCLMCFSSGHCSCRNMWKKNDEKVKSGNWNDEATCWRRVKVFKRILSTDSSTLWVFKVSICSWKWLLRAGFHIFNLSITLRKTSRLVLSAFSRWEMAVAESVWLFKFWWPPEPGRTQP